MAIDRRSLMRMAAAAGIGSAMPESIRRALAIEADRRGGTIQDVEHIVVMMQENRPFDQYFGTLRGVRGFNDPRAVTLPNGDPVFAQPDGDKFVLPFNPPDADPGLSFYQDVVHNWNDSHGAWNNGDYDGWIANKTRAAMIYFKRSNIPFHYAIADAFTICDQYFCSVMGPTDPNRYYMFTGWLGQGGSNDPDSPTSGATQGTFALRPGGDGVLPFGPVTDNAEEGYSWRSYPERLTKAGVSWKVYQDQGLGLNAAGVWGFTDNPYIGNFGDTALLYLLQYQNATPGTPLFEAARRGTDISAQGFDETALFADLRNDVLNDRLPQVSYIVAPEAFTEHPNWAPDYGAWYVSNVLSALTANPKVWAKTVLLYTFDEAGGMFDHIVQPTPPTEGHGKSTGDTVNELYPGTAQRIAGPYGLGSRVPMIIVSPWSKGGWVCSEVFDHTSIIRFIEKRFGVQEPNITPWRRAVCGDLTAALNFSDPDKHVVRLPDVTAFEPPQTDAVNGTKFPNANLSVPSPGTVPAQEQGVRPARPLPYRLQVGAVANLAGGIITVAFDNPGSAGACFHVRSPNGSSADGTTGPWNYTVDAGKSLTDIWSPDANGSYELTVNGPNGFFRKFTGTLAPGAVDLGVTAAYDANGITLQITNNSAEKVSVEVTDTYSGQVQSKDLARGDVVGLHFWLSPNQNWYDLVVTTNVDPGFVRQYAGHVENAGPSTSDPKMGQVQPRRPMHGGGGPGPMPHDQDSHGPGGRK
ncbi:MAG TPA: phospholipase C, phosphocholine-specific [Acetobacteraceae bacterium]|nr:phospholipase C, phosphocholine-specific [Acetobacteraceae bacterium]